MCTSTGTPGGRPGAGVAVQEGVQGGAGQEQEHWGRAGPGPGPRLPGRSL